MNHLLIRRVFPIPLCLSLLLHLLLLLSMVVIIHWPTDKKKKLPTIYQTSAYLYRGSIAPIPSTMSPLTTTQVMTAQRLPVTNKGTKQQSHATKAKPSVNQASVLGMTYRFLQQNQEESVSPKRQREAPIYMVGDKNSPVDPLAILLGRAISAHFAYPHQAAVLGIRGRALVGFTLHPNGRLTEVRLLQSAENSDLDAAALYAVNAAPVIRGVDKFVSKPTYLVVAFIFR